MARLDDRDAGHLRRALALAREARGEGNAPFGAVLVGGDGRLLAEGKNTATTGKDPTGHAETNLVRAASRSLDPETLASSTLYASAEPCAMCSGAIFWGGVGRVVYGLGADRIYEMFPPDEENPVLVLPCREVLAAGTGRTEVVGPALEEEAEKVFGDARPARGAALRTPETVESKDGEGGDALDERGPVRELRVALTVDDFEGAVALYGEALGLRVVKEWDEPHGRGAIFAAGAATVELLDRPQAEYIDEVEAGGRVSGPVRLALGVADVDGASRSLRGGGAEAVAAPVTTPWGDRNQRLRAPDGMQLTLFRTEAG